MKRTWIVGTVVLLTVSACGPRDRPDFDAWRTDWEAALGVIPPPAFADAPDEATCERVVGELREARESLIPTPDITLDGTVREWIAIAEQTFFECPPREGEVVGFAEAYEELDRLRLEVEAVLGAADG